MTSSSTAVSGPLGPIPEDVLNPSDPIRMQYVRARNALANLQLLASMSQHGIDSHAPNVWGFTVYRAVFGPGSDERFAAGLARLDAWARFYVRQSRYLEEDEQIWEAAPQYIAQPPERDVTDELADRLWNEVIEDYPDKLAVRSAPEGTEDFSPVGRHFISWVDSLNVHTSNRIVRYDHCLVLDDAALLSLEKLPAEIPEVKPRPWPTPERRELGQLMRHTWVWLLDRQAMEDREAGVVQLPQRDMGMYQVYPPWMRIRLDDINLLWFHRPKGYSPVSWTGCAEEDKVKWDRVFWWCPTARTSNQARRQAREEAARQSTAEAMSNLSV